VHILLVLHVIYMHKLMLTMGEVFE
jgi:hypothetical protein